MKIFIIKNFAYLVVFALLFLGCSSPASDDADNDIFEISDTTDSADTAGISDDTNVKAEADIIISDPDITDNNETPDIDTAPCIPLTDGIYDISGTDTFGDYTGTAEIAGKVFYRLITYDLFTSLDGKKVALALEGTIDTSSGDLAISFSLGRVGFITAVGAEDRTGMEKAPPVQFSGTLANTGCNKYSGKLSGSDKFGKASFDETWQRSSDSGLAPIWQNLRQEIKTADSSGSSFLTKYFVPADYANSAKIAPYKDRPEFKAGIHLAIYDPTDYDFYQSPENKDTYRVIQKMIDNISIAEAQVRNEAYRYKLNEKELFYAGKKEKDGDVQKKSINELGMMSHWNEAEQAYFHDGDALLWTGVYVAAMSMKFMDTKDSVSLGLMLKSLDGIIKCLEITGTGTAFGRTVRTYIENRTYDIGDPAEWVRGTGAFSGIEYKVNGNNDMSKGFLTGYLWAALAISQMTPQQYAAAQAQYGDIWARMFNTLQSVRDQHELYQWSTTNPKNLPAYFDANAILKVIAILSPNIADNSVTINPLHWPMIKQYREQDTLSYLNEDGASDWSGNHLGIVADLDLYTALKAAGENDTASSLAGYISDGDKKMKRHRLGFFQMVSGKIGSPEDPENITDGLWVLREMGIPKSTYPINWEINPDYCMSPIPELVWKQDWQTNDRSQSIRAYTLFERPPSSYAWKDNPYRQYFGQGDAAWTGIDFLIAYWFGRHHGIITPEM